MQELVRLALRAPRYSTTSAAPESESWVNPVFWRFTHVATWLTRMQAGLT